MIVPPCRIGMRCHYYRMDVDVDGDYCFYPYLDPSDDCSAQVRQSIS